MIFNRYEVVWVGPSGHMYHWSDHTFKFMASATARDKQLRLFGSSRMAVLDRNKDDPCILAAVKYVGSDTLG